MGVFLTGLVVVGCRRADGGRSPSTELRVFAAASLTEAFEDLCRGFEREHPEVEVRPSFAGSQVLRLQIQEGAVADVFASADARHMQTLVTAGLVADHRDFASNELVVIVPKERADAIESFADLGRASHVVLGSDEVPVGVYSRKVLDQAGERLGAEFADTVWSHVVSRESNVRLVRAKVELGEADAAIVYRTDALTSARVRMISIPPELNVRAEYPIGTLAASEHPTEAAGFVDYVMSAEGRQTLERHGFSGPGVASAGTLTQLAPDGRDPDSQEHFEP